YIRELSLIEIDYYNDSVNGALANGTLGERALVYQKYQKVLTSGMLADSNLFDGDLHTGAGADDSLDLLLAGYVERVAGDWWIASGVQTLEAGNFYQSSATTDPWGNETTVEWDDAGLLITEVTDAVGNSSEVVIDYRVLAPNKLIGINNNWREVAFDLHGRVIKVAVVGKNGEGDTLNAPTTVFSYHDDQWSGLEAPNYAFSKTLKEHDSGALPEHWQETYTYSDGGDNVVQVMAQAEHGDVPARNPDGSLEYDDGELVWENSEDRWVGTGRTVVNNKGKPTKQYEPFFKAGSDYEVEKDLVEWGKSPTLHYDAAGRNIRTDLPDGTYTEVKFDPWLQETWDPNDTVDGTDWESVRLGDGDAKVVNQADQAAANEGTPTVAHFDAQGRPYKIVVDSGTVTTHVYETTQTTMDVSGNPLVVNDALGNDTQTQVFDMTGRALRTDSPDAGHVIAFVDAADQPLHTWKPEDLEVRASYDELRRPVTLEVKDNATSWRTHQYTFYGDQLDGAEASARADDNIAGQPYRVYDGAGMVQADSFDFKGNPLSTTRTFNDNHAADVDWADAGADVVGAVDLAAMDTAGTALSTDLVFNTTATFDAMDRPTAGTSPTIPGTVGKQSTTKYEFNKAGLLQTVQVHIRGAVSATDVVKSIAYDAKGRRTQIVYASSDAGNDVTTDYSYDTDSQRLTRLKTTLDTTVLQDLTYYYDAAGNIVEVSDGAQSTLFFQNTPIVATSTYVYDGAYRLVEARGREKPANPLNWWEGHDRGLIFDPGVMLRRYTHTYTYDKVGNLEKMKNGAYWTRDYDYGDPQTNNRLQKTTMGATEYPLTYNDRGAMISMPHLSEIVRDFNDQMRKVTRGSVDGYYAYDAAGQRVRKTIEKTDNEDTFYLGGWELFRKGNATVVQEYETLHVMDDQSRVCIIETLTVDPVAPVLPATVMRFQLGNHLGSALLELDEAAGIISYEEYHPFGSTAWHAHDSTITARKKRYRYTGKERDEWTGLSYHGARYYAP
ncbi:MAG: toxin, partial [Actinomycetia bacterium]|nr:toxin [Actinomycetes bacterium]